MMFRGNGQYSGAVISRGVPQFHGVKWHFRTEGPIYSSPVVAEGQVFFGSHDGCLYAVDVRTGALGWKLKASAAVSATPLVAGGIVYIVDNEGNFFAVNAKTGDKYWSCQTVEGENLQDPWDYYYSSPCLAGELVVFGSSDHHVYALDRKTGVTVWAYDAGYPVRSSPVYDDGSIYAGDWCGFMHALDAQTGELRWSWHNPEIPVHSVLAQGYTWYAGSIMSSPVMAGGTLYFGSRDFHVYALDAVAGTVKWAAKNGSWVVSSPAVSDGLVVVGTSDSHTVCALDAQTGRQVWEYATGSNVLASPVIAGNLVYAASGWADGRSSGSDHVFALDLGTGNEVWKEQLDHPVFSSPMIDDGILYVGSTDGCLYAIY